MFPISPTDLAQHVVADGFDTQKDALGALYGVARSKSVSPVLIEVASDESEPRPVRERALGKLVVALSRS